MATTTIKLAKSTKDRLDKLKEYRRETYDEVLQKVLSMLTILSVNPERARVRLASIERKKRRSQNPLRLLKQKMKQKAQQRLVQGVPQNNSRSSQEQLTRRAL